MQLGGTMDDERRQHGRSDAPDGGPVARARRVELDRLEVGRGERCRPHVRQLLRSAQRSPVAGARSATAREWSMRCRRRAASTRRNSWPTFRTTLPGGSTNMVEGLYRGWDEVRSVPSGQQSGLRIIVLFTDGASNSVPADYPAAAGLPRALRTWDFPDNGPDPDNQTHANPHIDGLYHTETGAASPSYTLTTAWNSTQTIPQVPYLPLTSWHGFHRSSGIPSTFPLQTNALKVDGQPQNGAPRPEKLERGRRTVSGRRLEHQQRRAKSRRDHRERCAQRQRRLSHPHLHDRHGRARQIRPRHEPGEIRGHPEADRQRRDVAGLQHQISSKENTTSRKREADVAPAFQALQNQIIRLTK